MLWNFLKEFPSVWLLMVQLDPTTKHTFPGVNWPHEDGKTRSYIWWTPLTHLDPTKQDSSQGTLLLDPNLPHHRYPQCGLDRSSLETPECYLRDSPLSIPHYPTRSDSKVNLPLDIWHATCHCACPVVDICHLLTLIRYLLVPVLAHFSSLRH